MAERRAELRPRRYLAGGTVSLLGVLLLAVPAYDMWDDTTTLSWGITSTVLENVLFVLLTTILIFGGIWLVRSDWATTQVVTVAERTVLAAVAVGVLLGWAMTVQLLVMETFKPLVLALNGVLIGTVASFGLSVSSVQADLFRQEVSQQEAVNERLKLLYRAATELETAASHDAAYAIVEDAIADVSSEAPFKIVVDDEVVAQRPAPGKSPVTSIDIGDRGRIDLFGTAFDAHEVATIELFGSFLHKTIQRIEREEQLRTERDVLEFVNHALRHDVLSDLSLLKARLGTLDREGQFDEERHRDHLTVALDRVDEMESFVRTMRTYVESVSADEPLEPVALPSLVEEQLETAIQAYPEADIECGEIPAVAVLADDLLDRVFSNLLANAVEHNDTAAPRVRIDAERTGDDVVVRISDNGPGIDPALQAEILDREETGSEGAGHGFGLALVIDIVDRYGGTVRFEDNDPRGTVVVLTLPVADDDAD